MTVWLFWLSHCFGCLTVLAGSLACFVYLAWGGVRGNSFHLGDKMIRLSSEGRAGRRMLRLMIRVEFAHGSSFFEQQSTSSSPSRVLHPTLSSLTQQQVQQNVQASSAGGTCRSFFFSPRAPGLAPCDSSPHHPSARQSALPSPDPEPSPSLRTTEFSLALLLLLLQSSLSSTTTSWASGLFSLCQRTLSHGV